ncbi:MAG: hypothetical protein HY098_00190 [Nitrospinae bacterium]|nr:hypothetical protein [Nitrospinota bacterium]
MAGLILSVGLFGSAMIYLTAENEPDAETAYQFKQEDSKRYVHELELFGGKANVVASNFRIWFGGLWEGKRLASTVAWITVITFSAFLFFAGRPEPGSNPEGSDDRKHEGKRPAE